MAVRPKNRRRTGGVYIAVLGSCADHRPAGHVRAHRATHREPPRRRVHRYSPGAAQRQHRRRARAPGHEAGHQLAHDLHQRQLVHQPQHRHRHVHGERRRPDRRHAFGQRRRSGRHHRHRLQRRSRTTRASNRRPQKDSAQLPPLGNRGRRQHHSLQRHPANQRPHDRQPDYCHQLTGLWKSRGHFRQRLDVQRHDHASHVGQAPHDARLDQRVSVLSRQCHATRHQPVCHKRRPTWAAIRASTPTPAIGPAQPRACRPPLSNKQTNVGSHAACCACQRPYGTDRRRVAVHRWLCQIRQQLHHRRFRFVPTRAC